MSNALGLAILATTARNITRGRLQYIDPAHIVKRAPDHKPKALAGMWNGKDPAAFYNK